MKIAMVVFAFAALRLALLAGALQAAEPAAVFRPGEIWPDDHGVHLNAHGGGILLHEGVYYWFGEHKIAGGAGNRAHVGVHVYSSRDLYRWKDEGVALSVSDDPASEIARGCILERPKVVYNAKTRRFVMWLHLEFLGRGYATARAALAVSDRPTGPFTYVRSIRPNAGIWPVNVTAQDKLRTPPRSGEPTEDAARAGDYLRRDFAVGQMVRDLTVFVDDDAKAYLVHAAEDNFTLHIDELTDDYQGFTGKWTRVFPGGWNEGPALFKRGGKYYMITSGCTGWRPNAARSAVADSICGPWQALGNPCRGTPAENEITFDSQSTFVLPAPGRRDAFIFMADRWRPKDAIDGRYLWLPLEWENDRPTIKWRTSWSLADFDHPL
jgi:hypothetical protein